MNEVDWSQFDDWLKFNHLEDFLLQREIFELTDQQQNIVSNNAKLLLRPEKWKTKVDAFENALNTIENKEERDLKRGRYCIHFDNHKFDRDLRQELNFSYYKFPCSVSFNSVNFGQGVVNFKNAIFGDGKVSFYRTQFGEGKVSFRFAQFGKGLIDFSQARFGDVFLEMSPLYLNSKTEFRAINMSVEGEIYLAADFSQKANFYGLKVAKTTNLNNSIFKKCPNFLDTDFGRPPEIAGMKVPPPEMKGGFFKTCPDGEAAPKYRKLSAMAKAANDHDKELEFFAYEMMAKRGYEITDFWELLANSFYYHVSYYGQSWIRPLFGVFISWFVFTFIYLNNVATILKAGSLNFSAIYSALNSFPFLSSLHRLTLKPQDYEGSLEKTLDTLAKHDGVLDSILNWAMFQQFIGIVLLFFLLLGLRNRFRLK